MDLVGATGQTAAVGNGCNQAQVGEIVVHAFVYIECRV